MPSSLKTYRDCPLSKEGNFRLLRTFVIADFITFANASCGISSIFLCLNYIANPHKSQYMWSSFLLPFASLIFDILDGEVARRRSEHSILGKDLDSLSDVVSFCVAPSVIGYTIGLRGLLDVLCLMFFVVCSISRLARYNATSSFMENSKGKVKYYIGFPLPTSLCIVLLLFALWHLGLVGEYILLGKFIIAGWTFHPMSMVYFLWGLMMTTSRVKIAKP
eukprot:GHVR01113485.1.p1 GENE.GHVR01113485.1~~GHVR01113485.1.p1  ORF type:complete len:220 (+),score=18.34 GHVR01113485.1:30-689(+)